MFKQWRTLRLSDQGGGNEVTYRYRIRVTSMREHAEAVASSSLEFDDEGRVTDERSQEEVNLALLPIYVDELEVEREGKYEPVRISEPGESEADPYDAKLIADAAASFRLGVGRVVVGSEAPTALPAEELAPEAPTTEEDAAADG